MRRAGVVLAVLARSAVRGLQASPLPAAVAVTTIAIALLLVGAFALMVDNMQGLLTRFSDELQVVVYLDADLDAAAEQRLAQRVALVEGVTHVELVTADEALERFDTRFGGGELLEGLEGNPLPASLELELAPAARDAAGLAHVRAALDGLPGVDELAAGQDWVEGYARFAGFARSAAIALGGVLALAALLIVANTIRLAVYAREDEIEILALVGAGRFFLRTPFLLEGLAQGVLGGAVALLLLYASFHLLLPAFASGLSILLGQSTPHFFAAGQAALLVAAGAALGLAGSTFAVLGWGR